MMNLKLKNAAQRQLHKDVVFVEFTYVYPNTNNN